MKATTATTIFSVGILISFFLPWIDLGFYSVNGFEIPTSLDKLITVNQVFSNENDVSYLKFSYIMYLIPLFALINVVMDISKANFRTQLDEFGIGIIVAILLFAFIYSIHENAISTMSIGYYLTVLFGILGLFSFRKKQKEETTSILTQPTLKDDVIELDKTNLLNQLSQLHELKEKQVITDSIYEQERQSILTKLQGTQSKQIDTTSITQSDLITEPLRIDEEQTYTDQEYEALFNRKSWFQRNKRRIIGLSIMLMVSFSIWYFSSGSSNLENAVTQEPEKPANSYYLVNATDDNKVYFYETPHLTEKKAAYFNSRTVVYVQQIEFGFGYVEFTNDRGQKSKGWLWLQELEYCTECGE